MRGTILACLVLTMTVMTAWNSDTAIAMPHIDSGSTSVSMPRNAPAAGTCTLSSRYFRLFDEQPAPGVTVLFLKTGASSSTDETGRWRIDVPDDRRVTVRVIAPTTLIDVVDDILIPEGTVDVTYALVGLCQAYAIDLTVVFRTEGSVSRPTTPAAPMGFTPSDATRSAMMPAASPAANADNIPWLGSFWLTAPVVTVGVCGFVDAATQYAAEAAIQRWNEGSAAGLAWKLVRDDQVCDTTATKLRVLIKRETVSQRRSVLGRTLIQDTDGKDCHIDLRGTTCWVGSVTIALNPAGYDRLPQDLKMATVLHELGHAMGLAHARGCGDSIMWYNAGGCSGPPPLRPGADDIASLNELLAATLRVLQPPATPAPSPAMAAPPEPATMPVEPPAMPVEPPAAAP